MALSPRVPVAKKIASNSGSLRLPGPCFNIFSLRLFILRKVRDAAGRRRRRDDFSSLSSCFRPRRFCDHGSSFGLTFAGIKRALRAGSKQPAQSAKVAGHAVRGRVRLRGLPGARRCTWPRQPGRRYRFRAAACRIDIVLLTPSGRREIGAMKCYLWPISGLLVCVAAMAQSPPAELKRDFDHDGTDERIVITPGASEVQRWNKKRKAWEKADLQLPDGLFFLDAAGGDTGLRLIDLNDDGFDDAILSNAGRYAIFLWTTSVRLELGWLFGWSPKNTARASARVRRTNLRRSWVLMSPWTMARWW